MPFLTLTNPGGLDQRSRVPKELVLEAENLGLEHDGWLVMRPGAGAETLTDSGFTGPIQWLGRFVPTTGIAELWGAADNAGTAALARKSAGTWAVVTWEDTVTVNALRYMDACTLNGKYFLAYDSDVNRLHVWDGTELRRVGLIVATAPTVATLGGAGNTFTRHYRQRNATQVGGVTVRRSEPSSSVSISITDDTGVRVTKGAVSGDGETHWEVEAADSSSGPWYRIATVVVGTTTYDDTAASISTTNLSNVIGLHIPPPSMKYLVSDGTRLLGAGAWESSAGTGETEPFQNRVYFTRALRAASDGIQVEESIHSTVSDGEGFIDVGDGAAITGIAGPLFGDIYVFKAESVYKLTPTSDAISPYRSVLVSPFHGAIGQRCIRPGVGESGGQCLYFCSTNMVYRVGQGGIQELSQPIARDLRGSAFTLEQSFIGFDPASHQLFVNVTTGAPAFLGAYEQFTLDARSGRWSGVSFGGTLGGWILGVSELGTTTVLGESGAFLRSAVAATSSDGVLRMFLGGQTSDDATAIVSWGSVLGTDIEEPFTASVRWRSIIAEGRHVSTGSPIVTYRNPTGGTDATGTVTLTMYREDGTSRTQSMDMEAQDANDPQTIRTLVFEALDMADVYVIDIRATLQYDVEFTGEVWPGIDCIQVPYKVHDVRSA
jgi:hypothetical protein